MRSSGAMAQSAGVELSILLAAVVAVSSVCVPLLAHMSSSGRLALPSYSPPQRNAWNPYDCCFWEELPPAEFGAY